MAHVLSSASLTKLRDLAERGANRMKKIREESVEKISYGLQVVETVGAAVAAGYANQKFGTNGELTVMGIPADLGVGVLGIAAGFFGALGKYDEHAINVGSGLGAAYGYRLGASLGAATPAKTAGHMTSGPYRGGASWSPAAQVEMAEMG